jgi:hypothetical protein
MPARWILPLALALGVLLAATPTQAIAGPSDVAATHAYIQANYALNRASVASIGVAQAKIQVLNAQLARECPRVGVGSPENAASQPMAHEVVDALWSIAYGTNAGAIRTFAAKVARLRWSNHAITRMATKYASDLHQLASAPLPALCTDVRAWKASGFQILPASTLGLVHSVEEVEPTPIPPRLLAPYERGSDASVLARTKGLETKLEESEFSLGQSDWIQVLGTLGLSQ